MSFNFRKTFNYTVHVLLAGAFGAAFLFLVGNGFESAYHFVTNTPNEVEKFTELAAAVTQPPKVIAKKIEEEVAPVSTEKSIRVDLKTMTLGLYVGEKVIDTMPVLSKGRPGSAWETPTGSYEVETMELNHFSSIGRVWMPYSMQFFGNFFIHGWPYYEGGEPVSEGYSGGCIRLSTLDAKRVFEFSKKSTPVIVINGEEVLSSQTSKLAYLTKPNSALPPLSASAYLVADIETGKVILEKEKNTELPIASITKLMTALVSLETINQERQVTVSANALATYGEAGGLSLGEKIRMQDLIFPLLLESSNDASEVIAEAAGRHNFINHMNERAKAIGLSKTKFADPSGISPGNVSTPTDILKLTSYLFKDKSYLFQILRKKTATAPGHSWVNFLTFVNDERYLGGKSGHTTAARDTLVTVFSLPLAEFESRPIAIIILGSENREADTAKILNYLTGNIYYGEALPKPLSTRVGDAEGEESITLSFVGDIMLDRGVASVLTKKHEGDFKKIFEGVPILRSADILFGNLEGPLSDQGKEIGNLYSFRMSPNALPALTQAGFDVLSVANNHAGDWGKEAMVDTLKKLEDYQITPVGGGDNIAEASALKIIERDGIKVGYLAASDVGPNWLKATEVSAGIMIADEVFFESIAKAKGKVDVIVASFHFGDEYQTKSNTRQQTLARRAVDAGANLVIGHHPHVRQEIEKYRNGLIAYSLGNFVFDQYFSEETMTGMALEVAVNKQGKILDFKEHVVKIDSDYHPSISS